MGERDFVTIEEAAAIQVALEAARDQARTINTDDEEAIILRDRVIDACDAAESFLEAPHAQGAERDMRDMQAALDSIGEAFAARQIGGDDISYLRAPFESLEARLGRERFRAALLRLQSLTTGLRKGALGAAIIALEATLSRLEHGYARLEARFPTAAKKLGSAVESAVEAGRVLKEKAVRFRDAAYAAAERGLGKPDLTPWPTGLRLLPPNHNKRPIQTARLKEICQFENHPGRVWGLASMSSKTFISGGDDCLLRLWHIEKSHPYKVLSGHHDRINRITVLNEKNVVSAGDDAIIYWDPINGKIKQKLLTDSGYISDVCAISEESFISASDNGDVILWNNNSHEKQRAWLHTGMAQSVAAFNDTNFVSGDHTFNDLCYRNINSADPIWNTNHINAKTWKIAACNEVSFLTVQSGSSIVHCWNIEHHQPVFSLQHTKGICEDIALFSTNTAVTVHKEGIAIWDFSNQRIKAFNPVSEINTPEPLQSVTVLPSNNPKLGCFVTGGENGYIAYWEVDFS